MALGGVRVRAVLLDGLGTLVGLADPWQGLAEGLRRDYGIELSAADAQWAFAAEIDYYRAHHLEGRDRASLAALRERCAEVLHASLPAHATRVLSLRELTSAMLGALRFSVYPDALSTLSLLRARGLRLVVVSNWDVSLAPTLEALGLGETLDAVVTSAGVGVAKPAPEVFHAALGLIDVSPGEAVHVGDDFELDVRRRLRRGRDAGAVASPGRRAGGDVRRRGNDLNARGTAGPDLSCGGPRVKRR